MPPPKTPLSLNQRVEIAARGKAGQKVGRGECWDLAEQALEDAGAQTSRDLGEVGDDTDYVWGDPIQIKDIMAGDILQIRDHEVMTKTVTTWTYTDGTVEEETKEETASRGHHTAVVLANLGADGSVPTLEQHVKPLGKIVQKKKLYTRSLDSVTTESTGLRVNPTTKKRETATISKAVTVTVTGTIWAYRPKAK